MSVNRRCPIFRLWVVLTPCVVLLDTAAAQTPPGGVKTASFTSLPVRVREDSEVSARWKLGHARLRESIIGVWGDLEVENASLLRMRWARFYAEYFDSAGRTCLTLVFATQANAEHLQGDDRSLAPGEKRDLRSLVSDSGPAVEPVEVRVRLIEDQPETQAPKGGVGNGVIRSPVGIAKSSVPEHTIRLKLDKSQRSQPVLDMVLSKLQVGPYGNLQDIEILQSSNPEVKRWFFQLAAQNQFADPATSGLANVSGTALVLVRIAIPSKLEGARTEELLPRSSNWVRSFVRTVQDKDLPPVTQLLLTPSAESIPMPDGRGPLRERETDPDLFEDSSAGSFWCGPLMEWAVIDGVPTLSWRAQN